MRAALAINCESCDLARWSPFSVPRISQHLDHEIFSSWPDSALVAGVKIGSGNRAACLRPAGRLMPHTVPDSGIPSNPIRQDNLERRIRSEAESISGQASNGREAISA